MDLSKSYAVITVGSTNFPLLILSLFQKYGDDKCIISQLLDNYDLVYLQYGNSRIIQKKSNIYEYHSIGDLTRLLEVQWNWLVLSVFNFKELHNSKRVCLPKLSLGDVHKIENDRIIMKPYFDEMPELLKSASLVISHAGSGSVLEFLLGPNTASQSNTGIFHPRFMLACPNPFLMDNHQGELCAALDGLNFVGDEGNLKLMIMNCGENLMHQTGVPYKSNGNDSMEAYLNQQIHDLYRGISNKLRKSFQATQRTASLSKSNKIKLTAKSLKFKQLLDEICQK